MPDYHEIVKNPIDLGLIKQKLQGNLYYGMQEFVNDVLLVFENCELYFGRDSTTKM